MIPTPQSKFSKPIKGSKPLKYSTKRGLATRTTNKKKYIPKRQHLSFSTSASLPVASPFSSLSPSLPLSPLSSHLTPGIAKPDDMITEQINIMTDKPSNVLQPKSEQLKLTLFTPTLSIADKLSVRYVRFQTINNQTMSVFSRLNNSTFQIMPGPLFIVENGVTPGDCDREISDDIPSIPHPFQTPSISTPPHTHQKGFRHHLFFISGGIAVKRKDDLIISALQLIHPQHLDPKKIDALVKLAEVQSQGVMEHYELLRQLRGIDENNTNATRTNTDPSSSTSSLLFSPSPLSSDTSTFNATISPRGYTQIITTTNIGTWERLKARIPSFSSPPLPSTFSPTMTKTTTQSFYHPAHPSIEYAIYDDRPYITSIINDVAISLENTLIQVDKIQSKILPRDIRSSSPLSTNDNLDSIFDIMPSSTQLSLEQSAMFPLGKIQGSSSIG